MAGRARGRCRGDDLRFARILARGPDHHPVYRAGAEPVLALADRTPLVIDFRYHLVSIVAVFLALAIGIVVGAQAITPKLADSLNKASAAEVKQNKMLYAHNQQLKNEIAADGA